MSEYPVLSQDMPTSATLPDVPRHVTSDLSLTNIHALEKRIEDLEARLKRLENPRGRGGYPHLGKRY